MSFNHFSLSLAGTCSVIAGIQWGDPKAKTLLFVHGWLDNLASFIPLSDKLEQYNCIAIDLPGHGRSSHKNAHYHFIDWVDDLYQIIQSLREASLIAPCSKKIHLVGHSLGALISSVFCATFPEEVEQLVMIEGFGPLCASVDESVHQLRRTILHRQRLKKKNIRSYCSIEQAVQSRLAVSDLDYDNAALIIQRNLKQLPAEQHLQVRWQWRYDLALTDRSPLRMTESQAQFFCSAIQCPALLIKAETDSYISVAQLLQRKKWFELLDIDSLGKGHHVHMVETKQVAQKIAAFVSRF